MKRTKKTDTVIERDANAIKSRRTNVLNRYEKILNIYRKYKEYDTPNTIIFDKYIKDNFDISFSTFNNILSLNIKREREKLGVRN